MAKNWARIVGLCTAAAVVYGIVHDQITARICLEYFTIGHTRAFAGDSPTLHALYWGVVATWWAGAGSGVLLACAARIGRWPRLSARDLWPLVLGLLIVMGLAAAAVGAVAHSLAANYPAREPIRMNGLEVPMSEYTDFVTCAFVHAASYQVGFFGSLVVAMIVLVKRWRHALRAAPATTPE